ncbi:MAG: translation elongation factor 2 (EF-2/EF-G) [Candidatus Electronema aureum]|uniref:Elongation factor G n=1 Tax=Candidatus Electronema aureum TaxID=2005002 RepID=A0A521G165_9BACT|nr:MAG: translation elongation factor 2 (EF-2/EF-G) [Candidatus Electronema aureum]
MRDVQQIRNMVILGHGHSGKTTLSEALLFTADAVGRLGRVDEGSSVLDFEEEEIHRKISISAAFGHLQWQGCEIFLTDTPGDDNFINETKFAARLADSALLTVGGVLGVRSQTERFVDLITERKLPCLICITKMDRERANFLETFDEIRQTFATLNPAVIYLPIGAEKDFKGVVDVINNRALFFRPDGTTDRAEIPAELVDEVDARRASLMEYVAETDDDLLEHFLEEGELSDEALKNGLAAAVRQGKIAPVLPCSPLNNAGSSVILDTIAHLLPSPDQRPVLIGTHPKTKELVQRRGLAEAPFSAQVLKTTADPFIGRLTVFRVLSGTLKGDSFYNSTKGESERFSHLFLIHGKEEKEVESVCAGMIAAVAKLKNTGTGDTLCEEGNPVVYEPIEPLPPVISYAVTAKVEKDEEKLFSALTKMLDEDLTLRLTRQTQTHEVLLSGIGQVHLEVIKERLKRKFGVEMDLAVPKIPYRETLKGKATAQGKHKKQSGGRGQFGDCTIEIEPLKNGEHFEFVDKIVGGTIPQQYRPAVEKGIVEAMEKGVLAGYPFEGLKISLLDGSYHNVDSSEMAFKIAGSLAFKQAVMLAHPVLLEPVMEMEIRVDKEHVGDVMGDLNSRRGKVLGMDSNSRREIIRAQVPQAEIQLYGLELTSMTGGRGTFTVKFSHYEEVPAHIAQKIIAAHVVDVE